MKQLSKTTKLSLLIIIFIIIILIILIAIYPNNRNNSILFKNSYENYAWGARNYGYYIYSNGNIKEYDDYDNKKKLKSAKISKEELNQLKELANIVEDKYEESASSFKLSDSGIFTKQIYNSKLSKQVVLSKKGDSAGNNLTETSQKILKLTDELYNKYLNEK